MIVYKPISTVLYGSFFGAAIEFVIRLILLHNTTRLLNIIAKQLSARHLILQYALGQHISIVSG
jgi:hypothetical protein